MDGQRTTNGGGRILSASRMVSMLPGVLLALCMMFVASESTDAQIMIKPLKVTTASLPDGARGESYVAFVNASGGTPPYVFTIDSGSLHTGLSLSTGGAISGTPQSEGVRNFTVRVRDAGQLTVTKTFSINVIHYPRLQSLFPAPNSHAAATTTNVVATFTKDVYRPSSNDFTLHGSASGRLAGTFFGDNTRQLQFTPSQPLSAGEEVELTLTTGLRNLDRLAMRKPYVARFRAATGGPGQGDTWNEALRFNGFLGVEEAGGLSMHLVDLNGDNVLDLINGGGGDIDPSPDRYEAGSIIWIYYRTATGELINGSLITRPVGYGDSGWSDILTGDIDNDGDIDIITLLSGTDRSSTLEHNVFLNDGNGSFDSSLTFHESSSYDQYERRGDMGDIDGDGDIDLIVSTYRSTRIYRNNGLGVFTPSDWSAPDDFEREWEIGGGELADLDNDGDLDFISRLTGSVGDVWNFRIDSNDGIGTFATARIFDVATGGYGNKPRAIRLADMDNDGDLDIVSAHDGTPETPDPRSRVLFNDGAMNFMTWTMFGHELDDPSVLKIGDMNGDGFLDIVMGNFGQNRVYLNDGAGNFPIWNARNFGTGYEIDPLWGATPVFTNVIALGDLDGDRDLDMAVHHGSQVFRPGSLEARNRLYVNQ